MHSTVLTAAALLLAGVNAQTFTDCNPLEKTTCPTDPALGTTLTTDFTAGASDDWSLADGTTLNYGSDGAEFTISTKTGAPTISSDKYIFFGKVDAVLKAAPGTGIVSSFILESDDLDEIDWEWLGSTDTSVESNFFGKGNTTTYDRAIYHTMSDPIGSYHTYTIDWTSDSIKWSIDGNLVRTLAYGDALALGGKNYPQTPMKVKMGNWVGCADEAANQPSSSTYGTCQWAGGVADFTNGASYTMSVKSVTIQDYSCGSEYAYGDTSGSYESIKITGECNGKAVSSSAGSSATPSATSSGASTSSGGIFAQTSTESSAMTTGTSSGGAAAATTLSTSGKTTMSSVTSTGTSGSSPSPTTATPSQVTANAASTLAPKTSKFGALDFTVVALGLTLGYFVM